jgi:hypothetical protein
MVAQFVSMVRGAAAGLLFFALVIATPARAASTAPDSACLAQIGLAQARMTEFNQLYEQCRRAGIPLDYPAVAKTMLEQFLPLARQDAEGADVKRAGFEVKDFQRTLEASIAQMKACLQDPGLAPNPRRFETGQVEVRGLSFIAHRTDAHGHRDRGPVFFCGYGHFDQVRKDLPRWPGYGVNIIQIELGPAGTLVGENEVSLQEAEAIVKVLDEAAAHNVMVNILLSPHYFPGWAYAKWPGLAQGSGSFGYCVDAPGAKQVIEKFLRVVIPMFKNKPALHSFCLSNEPNFSRSQDCANTRALWARYLAKTHQTVAALNARYGSHYASFAEVPIPGLDQPEFYDYSIFNEQRFAAWHKWMGDVIHSMAPKALVHAKIQMEGAVLSRWYHKSSWGVDPELFGQWMDLNGDDCIILEPEARTEWALGWQLQNMAYDLQRSLAAKPIFNSENHPTLDGYREYVAPEHFRTALWQGAIHGQGATTIWVWERTSDPANCLYGNVMDRPGCAQAVGVTCLDLNRFAGEVTALQKVKAPVAIVYSGTSIKPDRRYIRSVETIYTALNFSGIKLDFISERQLIAGRGRDYKLVVVPDATQLLPQAVDALTRLRRVRLALAGDSLAKDCYGQATPAGQLGGLRARALLLDAKLPARQIRPALCRELGQLGALPELRVVDAATGEAAWGVEWLPARVNGRTVINAVNLLREPVQVRILRGNRTLAATDLLSLGGREQVETLKPMTPVLASPRRQNYPKKR